MASVDPGIVRPELMARRARLAQALAKTPQLHDLQRLLGEVDAALGRLDTGCYGICETCHTEIEPELLQIDPLARFCIGDLSEAERRDLERDLEVAGRIQRGMVPGEAVSVGPWQLVVHFAPAGPVSGDLCDVVPLGDGGELLLVLGDVTGKGVAAGLLSAHIHAIFRSLADPHEPVAELVTRANRVFRHTSPTPHFATLVVARASAGGSLEVCNAGHWPPLVVRPSGVTTLEPTGLPLGTFLSSRYTAHTLRLAADDLLLVYTDGLTEARNATGLEYSSERLEAVLAAQRGQPPRQVVRACLDDVTRHLAGEPQQDDLTLAVLQYRP